MKKSTLLVTTVAGILALTLVADMVLSQGPGGGPSTVVIDITYVFDHHDRFQQQREGMRREVEASERQLQADREAIQSQIDQVQNNPTFKKGSPEYSQMEEGIAKKSAELNIKANSLRKKYMEQEAKIYYETYKEICSHVAAFAQQNNISMVVRISTPSTDPNDPQEILKELNKPVVFHHPGVDITKTILDGINRSAAMTQPPPHR